MTDTTRHTEIAGDLGTATAGDGGTATAGYGGTATAGHRGTATAGDGGTATAGYGGTATAGDGGRVVLMWWDSKAMLSRVAVGYIGENGLLPNIPYRCNGEGVIVPANQANVLTDDDGEG